MPLDDLRPAATNGVIFPQDLLALGYDANATRAVLKRLTRIGRGAYVLDRPTHPVEVHALRAIAAARRNQGSTVSHISAASLHGLPIFRANLSAINLYSPDRRPTGKGSVVLRKPPYPYDPVQVRGTPATPVAQTIIDCARTQPRDTAVIMADHALHEGLTTAEELRKRVQAIEGCKGASRARSVVGLADGRAESVGETRGRLICLDNGIAVTPQVEVCDERGDVITRLDLGVDGYRLGVAFDGRGKYRDYRNEDEPEDQKYWEEKLQGEQVEDRGYARVHVYWAMLDHPELVVGRIRRGKVRAMKLGQ